MCADRVVGRYLVLEQIFERRKFSRVIILEGALLQFIFHWLAEVESRAWCVCCVQTTCLCRRISTTISHQCRRFWRKVGMVVCELCLLAALTLLTLFVRQIRRFTASLRGTTTASASSCRTRVRRTPSCGVPRAFGRHVVLSVCARRPILPNRLLPGARVDGHQGLLGGDGSQVADRVRQQCTLQPTRLLLD